MKNQNANKKDTVVTKREKVPIKVNPARKTDIHFVPGMGPLEDSFVVSLSSVGITREVTIHHPIGVTDLDGADWVMTDTSEIQSLLSREKDPDINRLNQLRQKLAMEWAVVQKIILKDDKTTEGTYKYKNGTERSSALEKARKESDAAYNQEKLKQSNNKLPAGQAQPKVDRIDPIRFLPEELQENEEELRAYIRSKEVQDKLVKTYPQVYRTMSGPLANVVQKRINPKGVVLSKEKMFDAVAKRLLSLQFEEKDFPQIKEVSAKKD